MIDKGIRFTCCRCGRERFETIDFDDDYVPMNLFGDVGKDWIIIRVPHLTVLCPKCNEEFKKNLDEFMKI